MSANTDPGQHYTGRFAPSPTGNLHYGTLLAAVGSFLQARAHNGDWLVRIEDVDTTRAIAGADKDILNTLEAFGLEWDGEVVYQSKRTACYQQALAQLRSSGQVFPCVCSRKQLAETGSAVYPGTCRQQRFADTTEQGTHNHAIRIRVDDAVIRFNDRVMGEYRQSLAQDCGDFVIQRRDGLFAYQLAVVVDDALQNITEVVRGLDLLDSTPRQIYLQQQLGYATPDYCHLPLAVSADGSKISKSDGATRVDSEKASVLLVRVLDDLGQHPDAALASASPAEILQWAISHWDITQVPRGEFTPGPIAGL